MRCFIAIDLPEEIKSKIFHKFENLQDKNLFRGKLTEKENLHLTLKFLGSLTNEEIKIIKEKLREIKFGKFSCDIGKIGIFDEHYIKIIWVELLSDKLNELRNKIDEATSEIPMGHEKFTSHITVLRVKSVIDKQKLLEGIKKINFKNLNFKIKEFLLMKSELMRQGPKYKILGKFNLEN